MRLPPAECRNRFATSPVARLATVGSQGRPHLVPVTFAVAGDTVVTAVDQKPKSTRELRRIDNIRANPQVSLLVDHYADDWSALWWVRADGTAEVIDAGPGRTALLALLVARYPQYVHSPPAGAVVRITVTRWTGWSAAEPPG